MGCFKKILYFAHVFSFRGGAVRWSHLSAYAS